MTQLGENHGFLAGNPQVKERVIVLLSFETFLLERSRYVSCRSWHVLGL